VAAKTTKRFGAGLLLPLVIGLANLAHSGPTATPTATPSATPTPSCSTEGVSCQINSDCCSNKCSGTGGNKVCQPGPTATPTTSPTSTPTGLPMAPPPPPGGPPLAPLATASSLAPLPMTPPIQGRITATSGGQSAGPFAAAVSGDCTQPGGVNTDATMPFAVTSSAEGARNVLCDIDFRCEDANNPGSFFFGCEITLALAPVANSGFHDHASPPRPTGTLNPAIDTTPSSGDPKITTQYTATEVSGKVTLTASARLICCPTATFDDISFDLITKHTPTLATLAPAAHYDLIGVTNNHGINHGGTDGLLILTYELARLFSARFPGKKLSLNDMSLPWGGVFDINGNWGPDHAWHRYGLDIDIRSFDRTPQEAASLQLLSELLGFSRFIIHPATEPSPHFHLKF